jgi:predicted phage tail protein
MEGLTTIHLGGKLGQLFGKRWDLQVSSPAEAIRAIDVNLKGKLKEYLFKQGKSKFYKIGVGAKDALIEEKEITHRSGRSAIYITPVAKGKNSGVGKIFAAIAIAAVTYFTFGVGGAFANAAIATAGYSVAASLALGGVLQLLTPTPNFNNNAQGDSRGSNLFNGNASVITQGGSVGLVYGRALVTPMPISISFTNTDQIKADAGTITNYTVQPTNGGLIQFVPVTTPEN